MLKLKENDIVLHRRMTSVGVTTEQINNKLRRQGYEVRVMPCTVLVDKYGEVQLLSAEPLRNIGLRNLETIINTKIHEDSATSEMEEDMVLKLDYPKIIEHLQYRIDCYKKMKAIKGSLITTKEHLIDVKTLKHFEVLGYETKKEQHSQ